MTAGIMPCNGIVEERRRYNGSIPCRENKGLYDNEQSPSAQYGVVLKGKGAFITYVVAAGRLGLYRKDGVDSITTALKELERHGYLTRQRLRYDNGQLGDIEYTIHEQPVSTENTGLSPKRENPRQVKPEQAKPKQAEPEQENPAQLNTNPLKTKKSKKDKSITYPSIYPAEPEVANRTDGMDRIELIEAYREIIKENIEYDLLVLRYGRERLDEALELMLEVILSKRPYIRIAGDDFPREIVKSRFLKINSGHLEYVFDCIDKNTTKVGNIKAYLLAALYNAPATMDSYYRAEVNHDLYGC